LTEPAGETIVIDKASMGILVDSERAPSSGRNFAPKSAGWSVETTNSKSPEHKITVFNDDIAGRGT
jgi:hypothetical protein